tara:strand:- start:16 stop:657 length:642 start_codon:yes stop_codon:yes gene_type:complete
MITFDRRKRIYYTQAQTTNGLDTLGSEWMTLDNIEYIGQYHRYITEEVFTGAVFVQNKSRILIPYVDFKNKLSEISSINFDLEVSFDYDSVKIVDIPKSKLLNPSVTVVTNKDIVIGYTIRYFAYKVNDGNLIELNKESISKVGTTNGMSNVIWKTFKLKWKVNGPDFDILDNMGNIKESGIVDTNKRTVYSLSEDYPPLTQYITDFRNIPTI